MEFQINNNIKFQTDYSLLKKADSIRIKKFYEQIIPINFGITKAENSEVNFNEKYSEEGILLAPKDSCFVDFGDHLVGKISLNLSSVGSPPDAPAKIHLFFGETINEIKRSPKSYHGDLSSSWLQEELLTVDELPQRIDLSRRFAFRYLKIEVVDTSPKYNLNIQLRCRTESSADFNNVRVFKSPDKLLQKIDYISQKTLAHCMQDVFEDGPKRDRRLWLGDLRLQALANYKTFQVNDLVKKCLYLFAAKTTQDGQVSANVFVKPKLIPDDTFLADYSLFFIDTLLSYYLEEKDDVVLSDLYSTAVKQVECLDKYMTDDGEIKIPEGWWAFVDWSSQLNKQIAIQGIFIYSYKRLRELARFMKDASIENKVSSAIDKMEEWTLKNTFNSKRNLFVDPKNEQISVHSQAWMILAKIKDSAFRKSILVSLLEIPKDQQIQCTSPYMYHHFVEALFQEGLQKEALDLIKDYWGGMVKKGADTFWEVYVPEDPELSPYGDAMINSYCHAWSCTPCYLLRKYVKEDQ